MKPKHTVRRAALSDIQYIAAHLRDDDRQEILAATGLHPEVALPLCDLRTTQVWCEGETPIALFGMDRSPNLGLVGHPWMVSTPRIENFPVYFLRKSKWVIVSFLSECSVLTNYVDARNALHIKWLKWIGFTFDESPTNHGHANLPFWHFEMRQPECAPQP